MMRLTAHVLLASALIWLPAAVRAQVFPNGAITVVVPLAPGDAADIAARALGEEISRLLKTPVLSINRPGAGGAVGAHSVVQAKKDGQTILFAQNSALTFRAVLDPQAVGYDALRDLVPLGTASRTPSLLVVRSDAPYKSLSELIEYSKRNPGRVRVGHPGSARSATSACRRSTHSRARGWCRFPTPVPLPPSPPCAASTSKPSCCRSVP